MNGKIFQLENLLRARTPLLVAYSGGVDSTCLLAVAHRVLGDQVLGVIADSPSLPRAALAEARQVAEDIGAPLRVLTTGEFSNPDYFNNPLNRCYFCKSELFTQMESLAAAEGFAALAYGENADDPAHLRPGSLAAAEFQVLAPLKEAGLTKEDVRVLSRQLGLPTAEAPAQPCLSSRIPYGTTVTHEAVGLVERGEAFVRSLGFAIFRVRYVEGSPPGARVQIAPEESEALEGRREILETGLRTAGFGAVEIDPLGYRSATR